VRARGEISNEEGNYEERKIREWNKAKRKSKVIPVTGRGDP
jgi:hypothetical protein